MSELANDVAALTLSFGVLDLIRFNTKAHPPRSCSLFSGDRTGDSTYVVELVDTKSRCVIVYFLSLCDFSLRTVLSSTCAPPLLWCGPGAVQISQDSSVNRSGACYGVLRAFASLAPCAGRSFRHLMHHLAYARAYYRCTVYTGGRIFSPNAPPFLFCLFRPCKVRQVDPHAVLVSSFCASNTHFYHITTTIVVQKCSVCWCVVCTILWQARCWVFVGV